jgi:hypothetical protein
MLKDAEVVTEANGDDEFADQGMADASSAVDTAASSNAIAARVI